MCHKYIFACILNRTALFDKKIKQDANDILISIKDDFWQIDSSVKNIMYTSQGPTFDDSIDLGSNSHNTQTDITQKTDLFIHHKILFTKSSVYTTAKYTPYINILMLKSLEARFYKNRKHTLV